MSTKGDVRGGIPVTLVASAARTTSSNSGNLRDTATALAVARSYTIYLNCTAISPANGNNRCRVQIETSPDGGTTWLTALRFADINGTEITTTSIARRIDIQNNLAYGAAGTETGVTSFTSLSTSGSGAINANTLLTRDIRVAWDLGLGTTSATFAVYAICEP